MKKFLYILIFLFIVLFVLVNYKSWVGDKVLTDEVVLKDDVVYPKIEKMAEVVDNNTLCYYMEKDEEFGLSKHYAEFTLRSDMSVRGYIGNFPAGVSADIGTFEGVLLNDRLDVVAKIYIEGDFITKEERVFVFDGDKFEYAFGEMIEGDELLKLKDKEAVKVVDDFILNRVECDDVDREGLVLEI